jgi:hypothetical protein
MRATRLTALVATMVAIAGDGRARADRLDVGMFAPAAPFDSAAARVDLVNKLAKELGDAVGEEGVGRVYGRAADFAAAVKKGEVQVALVDATYLASTGSGTVIAASVHDGKTSRAWHVVARGGAKNVLALANKKLLVPAIGGKEVDFVLNAQFGGELAKSFFASISSNPDTASTLAALGVGKADAAVVPADAALPAGVSKVASVPSVPGPVLVVYGSMGTERKTKLTKAATGFSGDDVVDGFVADDGDGVRALGKRFTVPARKGPMAVPSVRIVVGDLVADRTIALEPGDPKRYTAEIPMPSAKPSAK